MKSSKKRFSGEMAVVLDNIRSAENVGSILRTSDAMGVSLAHGCGITPGPRDRFGRVNNKVCKASLGAESHIEWVVCDTAIRAITSCKKDGYYVVAIEQDNRSVNTKELSKKIKENNIQKIAFVLGTETEGLSQKVIARCDAVVEIDMLGDKESLNVAVAYAIVTHGIRFGS